MKHFLKTVAYSAAIVTAATFTSCTDDNSGIDGGGGTTPSSYQLNVTANNLNPELKITASSGSSKEVVVHFEGADKNMRRLYITKNDGTGREIYNINDYVAPAVTLNNDDGSIDLAADKKAEFTFTIPFQAPATTNGTVVYKLWTTYSPFTSSKGDILNEEFRNAYTNTAVGTIIINSGSAMASSPVKEFTGALNAISLYAPDQYGKTKSFVSILSGQTYKIAQQQKDVTTGVSFTDAEKAENAQYVSYWDFGYFYTNSRGACFSSANDYMDAFQVNGTPIVKITDISGIAQADLNTFYFKKDATVSYDAITTSGDLDNVNDGNYTAQRIEGLVTGDVVLFKNKYGVKGVVRVDEVQAGTGNNDYIKFSVKVQNVDYVKP